MNVEATLIGRDGIDRYLASIAGTPEGEQQKLGAKLANLQEQVPEAHEKYPSDVIEEPDELFLEALRRVAPGEPPRTPEEIDAIEAEFYRRYQAKPTRSLRDLVEEVLDREHGFDVFEATRSAEEIVEDAEFYDRLGEGFTLKEAVATLIPELDFGGMGL